jgi:glycosyltransferase involved in cell wall biosynthesis
MGPQKIAFIKKGSFSHINDSLLGELAREFPGYRIEVINAPDLVDRDARGPVTRAARRWVNRLYAVKEFGRYLLPGGKKLKHCLPRTSYFFRRMRGALRARLAGDRIAFTFQTQSLFDASVPGTPHFVYTDHASLATLQYPGIRKTDVWPASWIELEKTIYQNAALVFTMSANISRCLIEKYSCAPSKVACVYAGANVRPAPAQAAGGDRGPSKNVLFVGVDWERKGGPRLAGVFREVLKAHPDARLTVVGCSPQLDLPNCEVVGKVPPERLSAYFQRATVFCLPTRLEAFGIVFLEAFAHKLPVVATNIGAIPEFVTDGKNGYLVGYDQVKALADRLIELLGNPDRCRQFGEDGYRVVAEKYNWEMTAARMRGHIERVIRGGVPEPAGGEVRWSPG